MKTTYSVLNSTKKTTLTSDLKIATTLTDQLFGLLRQSNPRSLMFKTRFGIHTFFLKEAIDVIVLDSKNRVVAAKTIEPNSLFLWNPIYSTVIELPLGTIKRSKTSLNDQLKITRAHL